MAMNAKVLAALAGLFHVLFFAMESFLWRTPRVMKVFQQTSQSVELTAGLAYNQGFYNLFLALGVFVGLFLMRSPDKEKEGLAVVVFALLSMFGASIILVVSTGKVLGMAIQGAPPVLALVLFWLSRSSK
ncbi:MAG: DUF1304 domain-containing protein [Deltaproteobacteria bacterium]|nr:MAG: DUF1304 domain-containing protein [Deltaproteobacteria bacterium]